jgi:HAD superfamily hydrolase (TIGR01509 family)
MNVQPVVIDLAKALQGKRLLIFDFDGTLADTSPLHAAAFSQVLAPLGISVEYSKIAGMKSLDAIRHCMNETDLPYDEAALAALVMAKQQCVRQMISLALLPMPGVDAFLRWARPRYKLSMVTSGSRRTVDLAIEKLGYSGWFDPLICAEDVACGKPDPEGFTKALQLTGLPTVAALVFEDSVAGFLAAGAASLACVDARKIDWSNATKKVELSNGN